MLPGLAWGVVLAPLDKPSVGVGPATGGARGERRPDWLAAQRLFRGAFAFFFARGWQAGADVPRGSL